MVQLLQDDSGLHPRPTLLGVDFQHIVHVLGHVDYYGPANGLAGQAGAAAPGQNGHSVLAGQLYRGYHVLFAAGEHNPQRLNLVDAGVRAVHSA